MRIGFLWEDITNSRHRLTDGLGKALQVMKERHTIQGFEPDDMERIFAFKPDVLLYWAPLCARTKDLVVTYPFKKAIAFAGGAIEPENVNGFDLYFTESKINEDEFTKFGKPWKRAFGIDEETFSPRNVAKIYDGCFAGTFALWKRPQLFAEALGKKGVATGIHQDHEKECYEVCLKHGVEVHDELPRREVAELINNSYTVVNTAEFWGGGQRLTLEALACNVPPIVMSDSPKNREYVEESGYGMVVDPNPNAIREAISRLKGKPCESRDYILSKFTYRQYAKDLEDGLCSIR